VLCAAVYGWRACWDNSGSVSVLRLALTVSQSLSKDGEGAAVSITRIMPKRWQEHRPIEAIPDGPAGHFLAEIPCFRELTGNFVFFGRPDFVHFAQEGRNSGTFRP
jgi:hypothetical protein